MVEFLTVVARRRREEISIMINVGNAGVSVACVNCKAHIKDGKDTKGCIRLRQTHTHHNIASGNATASNTPTDQLKTVGVIIVMATIVNVRTYLNHSLVDEMVHSV